MSLPPNVIAIALVAIGLLAAARLLWKRPQRWPWRLLLQSGALLLVYLVLNPPPQLLPQAGTLTVLGAGWQQAHRVGPGPAEPHARLGANLSEAAARDQRDQDQAAAATRSPAGSGDFGANSAADARSGAEATVGQGPSYAGSARAEDARQGSAQRRPLNASAELGPSAAVIALPDAEDPLPPGVQRAPDLATALRMRPEFSTLRLFGRGLSLRDLQAARGRSLEFIPAPLPRGFVEVAYAPQVMLGDRIDVAARWNGAPPTRVQLLDAAGEVLAEQVFDAEAALSSASSLAPASALAAPSAATPASRTSRDPSSAAAEDIDVPSSADPAALAAESGLAQEPHDASAAEVAAPESGARDAAPAPAQASAASAVDTASAQERADATSQRDLGATASSRAGVVYLRAPARATGALPLRLRALDGDERTLDAYDFRVEVTPPRAPKVLLLAAAPGPETRALRRWAVDAGLDFDSRIQFAPGLVQGGRVLAPSTEELAALDLFIIEERAWGALGVGGRATVLAEVENGLGLLLRLTALPNPGLLAEWREAGFAIERVPGETSAQARLPQAPTRLRQLPIRVVSAQAASAVHTDQGEPLALWRARGLGRLGLIWLTDSYRLQAAGHGEVYGELWSEITSALARAPTPAAPAPTLRLPRGQTEAWAGERIELCSLRGAPSLLAPDGSRLTLAAPDAQGCVASLPSLPGRYRLADGESTALAIEVRDPGREAALHAADLLARTFAVVSTRAAGEDSSGPLYAAGDFRPWLLALLAVLALLWWLERPRSP
ncbi:hypothetical protein [Aquimonas voraii]|uniref:Uncharacterized protein n=1 Tax=Aquimonas voraii TaxID=265719 RepID=A0A1G6VEL3_9GAMM|nr:hypothetical protein [Aquimonas voraii]SDD51447.1 hypothetical protein SAMN04488509_10314 [Aquimonas voraii]